LLGEHRKLGGYRVQVVAVFFLERAALAERSPEGEGFPGVDPGEAVDVDRHQHPRGDLAALHDAQDGQAAHHHELRVARELARFVEKRLQMG
jgi:hypothetical protein